MFGYIQYDRPNMYIKDLDLYQALYCGVCKGIASCCGQVARMGLSYDSAFFSAILHNIKNQDVTIEKRACFAKVGLKRPMAAVDSLTESIAAMNTAMVYYKLLDDVEDEKKGGVKCAAFRPAFKRVKEKYPVMIEIIDRHMRAQSRTEKSGCDSIDMAADSTAFMIRDLSDYLLEEYATPSTSSLFYDIGKWIYLIDAADDYDKDIKTGNYNPFMKAYGAPDKATLVCEHAEDLNFLFNTLFYDIREQLSQIRFYFNRDLTDNILLRGLPLCTQQILSAEACKCPKKANAKERMQKVEAIAENKAKQMEAIAEATVKDFEIEAQRSKNQKEIKQNDQ